MLCPICAVELHIADRQGIEVDYCLKCRGVWLDRGELEKLVDRSVSEASSRRLEERGVKEERQDSKYTRPKKRASWLGELLDFD